MRARPLALAIALSSVALGGCDALLSGLPDEDQIFDVPIDGLDESQLAVFLAGDELFAHVYGEAEGLGPVYNAPSCNACHPGEGRGHPAFHFVRFGRGNDHSEVTFDYLPELGGPQLQNRAIPGYPAEELPPDVNTSLRTGPVIVGLGLLEAVPAATILSRVDPADADGDGISGRANYVLPPEFIETPAACACDGCKMTTRGCKLLGRFGRKARSISLLHQAARALHDDVGITSDYFPTEVFNPLVGGPSGDVVGDPEVPAETLNNIAFYLRTLRPPARRDEDDAQVQQGALLFAGIGCTSCHVPSMDTGDSAIAALHHTEARAYTDLLLHDMGDALADGVPDGEATGREWRTTPLWGLGAISSQLGGETYYLHDGRARTIEEAISFHGGEAESRRQAFDSLSEGDREALLAFLRSL